MNNVEKNQEQIDQALKDALTLQKELSEINRMAAKVSDKFTEIGSNIKRSSKELNKLTKTIAGFTKYKKDAEIIGDLTEIGLDAIGTITDKMGSWFAERKKNKKLNELLPYKKKLASEKIDFLNTTLPKISKDKYKMIRICKNDAPTILDYNDTNRLELVKEGLHNGFEAYFILENLERVCIFMKAEFNAWLQEKHQSNLISPNAKITFRNCVKQLVEWSKLPENKIDYSLITSLSVGSILLLTNKEIQDVAILDSKVKLLSNNLAYLNIKASLMPFNTNANEFKELSNKILSDSELVSNKIRVKKGKLLRNTILIIIIIIIILFFIFYT